MISVCLLGFIAYIVSTIIPVLITLPSATAITTHWLAILPGRTVQMAVRDCEESSKTVRLVTDGDPVIKQNYTIKCNHVNL